MKTKFLFYIGSVIILGVVVFSYNAVDNSLTEEDMQYIPKFLVGVDSLPKKYKFKDVIEYIAAVQKSVIEIAPHLPDGVVLCLPNHWDDLVAYKTDKKVLAGGHGFGFKLLEPIFPRILRPISEIIEEYHVKYLLTIDGYLPENFIKELPTDKVTAFDSYRLFELI